MTAPVLVKEVAVQEKPKRTRKSHNKVRSGCLTCKIRRKKCGEEKPFCKRCTSTGRKCDGYPTLSPPETSSSGDSPDTVLEPGSKRFKTNNTIAIPRHQTTGRSLCSNNNSDQLIRIWRSPSSVRFDDDGEFYCFDFFRSRTGPEFAAYFDSSMWRSYAIRACLQYPTVLAVAAAVGAAHRRFELGISPEAFEFCDISDKLYQRAIRKLSEDMASNIPNAAEINMLAMKLMAVYDTFQGDLDRAQAHMTAGLKGLLSRNFKTTYTDTQYRTVDINYESLRRLFLKIELESVRLFGGAYTILSDPEDWNPPEDEITNDIDPFGAPYVTPPTPFHIPDPVPYPIPRAFNSLHQARDVLFTEAKWIWHTWGLLERGILSGSGFRRHQIHISRCLQWSMAYAEYTKMDIAQRRTQDKHAAHLLKTYREAVYLLLLTQMAFHEPDTGAKIVPLCDPPETCDCHRSCRTYAERREALNAHFARLLVLAESIFNASSFFAYEEHALSLDSGIGPPLYVGTSNCRSTKVRHQVTNLLEKSEIQHRIWDSLGVYSIAEKVSSLEEHAVINCGAVSAALEPKWVDITFFIDERRVLLRYCTPDKEGIGGKIRGTGIVVDEFGRGSGSGGLVWTQQWIAF